MALPSINGTFRVMGDPNLRFTPNGTAALSARLSAGKKRKNTNEYDNFAVNLVVFGDQAPEIAEWMSEGMYVAVAGDVRDNEYVNKDGETRYTRELNASFGYVAQMPPRTQQGQAQGQPQGQAQASSDPFGGQPQQPQGQPQYQQAPQQQNYQQQPQQNPYQQPQQNPYGQQPQQNPYQQQPQQNPADPFGN